MVQTKEQVLTVAPHPQHQPAAAGYPRGVKQLQPGAMPKAPGATGHDDRVSPAMMAAAVMHHDAYVAVPTCLSTQIKCLYMFVCKGVCL